MAKKLTAVVLASILLAGCAQFAEMDEAREAGKAYLTGRFEEQICELEAFATAHPELNYTAERIVKEVVPSAKKDEVSFEFRTKYEAPNSKIRLYGKKVKFPITRDGVNAWIGTIDGNIAQLNGKMVATVEDARRKEEERIAEAKRLEEERLAKERTAVEEARRKEEERIAEAKRLEEVRLAKERAAVEEARRKEEERIAEIKRLEEERQRKEEERIAMENAAAEEARLREEARVAEAARLVAEMPESEKFPLLSVQPNPQMLMKGVHSGASKKWVEGWLVASNIKHNYDGFGRLSASLKSCEVLFEFYEAALVSVHIKLRAKTTVGAVVDKYSQLLGETAKIEKIADPICSIDNYEVMGQEIEDVVKYSRKVRIRVSSNEVGVETQCTDTGLVGLSHEVKDRLFDLTLSRSERFDMLSSYIEKDLVMAVDNEEVDSLIIYDRKLKNYQDSSERNKEAALKRAEEEAKKAKSAAALDF